MNNKIFVSFKTFLPKKNNSNNKVSCCTLESSGKLFVFVPQK